MDVIAFFFSSLPLCEPNLIASLVLLFLNLKIIIIIIIIIVIIIIILLKKIGGPFGCGGKVRDRTQRRNGKVKR